MVSVAGVLRREQYVLIARRLPGGDLGGLWEFPGGKLEPGESDSEALIREFDEELAIRISVGPLLASGGFVHNDKDFELKCYLVYADGLDFRLLDHDSLMWVLPSALNQQTLAPSDLTLVPDIVASLDRFG